MALTDAEKQEIIDGVLDSDHRIYAIQGTLGGDLTLDEGDTLTLTFTPSTVETVSTSLARLTPARAAALDLLAAIYEKTQLISSSGQILVSESSQGRIPETKAYVFAFDKATGNPALGAAATITANWQKDYGDVEALTDTNPTEIEDGVYAFDLTEAERTFNTVAYILPQSSTSTIGVVGLNPKFTMIENIIRAKVAQFTTGNIAITSPFQAPDKIVGPLVIGDDYLAADNRAIVLDVTTAFDPTSCFLGFENERGLAMLIVGEKVTYTNGIATIRFEITKTQSANLWPGPYDYSIEIRGASANEVTVIHSKTNGARVNWIRKYT